MPESMGTYSNWEEMPNNDYVYSRFVCNQCKKTIIKGNYTSGELLCEKCHNAKYRKREEIIYV